MNQPPVRARYVHTNLIARDFEKIVEFYTRVFGCVPATAEQDLSGAWVGEITGVANAEIRVVHLRLPGHGDDGPTLEVIRYTNQPDVPAAKANEPGFGHIAFAVADVAAARQAVLAAGGSSVGEVVTAHIEGRGTLTETYVTDPEGNIIELQHWAT